MSKKDPAFLFYPEKFINGTMFMTNEQTGKYIKLLCHEHQNGGLIDKDDFNNFVGDDKKLRAKFIETDDGFFNEKLMSEIEKRKVKSENMSVNAKIRWNEHKQKQCNCITNVVQPLNKDKDVIVINNRYKEISKDFHNFQNNQFPKLLKVVDDKLINDGAVELEKLVRIDGYTEQDIISVLSFIVKDDFWNKNVLSLRGIRNKGNNGNIKFVNAMVKMSSSPGYKKGTVYEDFING